MALVSRNSNPSLDSLVAAFRRFNRMYTHFIGWLDEQFLDSGYSLAEGRMLYELAKDPTPTAKMLGRGIGLLRTHISGRAR